MATPVAALIASGGMHAGLVLPARETMCSGRIPLVTGLDVAIDDRLAGRTREPWTMGGPAATFRWLAARLAERDLPLREGQVILTGSPLPLFPVGPGRRVVAEAGPLGMSSVAIDGPGVAARFHGDSDHDALRRPGSDSDSGSSPRGPSAGCGWRRLGAVFLHPLGLGDDLPHALPAVAELPDSAT